MYTCTLKLQINYENSSHLRQDSVPYLTRTKGKHTLFQTRWSNVLLHFRPNGQPHMYPRPLRSYYSRQFFLQLATQAVESIARQAAKYMLHGATYMYMYLAML